MEELTCLATWRDGNSRYLVGLVSHHHAVSNEERYRCFVYEKILSNGNLYSIFNALSHSVSLSTQSNIHLNYEISGIIFIADESSKDAEYKLAQSGDATCNGLDSAEVLLLFSSQII